MNELIDAKHHLNGIHEQWKNNVEKHILEEYKLTHNVRLAENSFLQILKKYNDNKKEYQNKFLKISNKYGNELEILRKSQRKFVKKLNLIEEEMRILRIDIARLENKK